MTYDDFATKFIENLQAALGEEVELKRVEVNKVNSVSLDGISIKMPNSHIAPTIYLEDFYPQSTNGYNIHELVLKAKEIIDNAIKNEPFIPDFAAETTRKNLYGVLINYESNVNLLKTAVHESFEDLAFVVRLKVGDNGSILVTEDLLPHLKLTSQEALEIAHNAVEKDNYICESMRDTIMGIVNKQELSADIELPDDQNPIYVITNSRKCDGAVAISSNKILKSVWNKIGGDYYILPSSRHEVIVVPKTPATDINALRSMVHDVNATAVDKIDKLGDSVYLYNGRCLSRPETVVETISSSLTENLIKSRSMTK
ncbi:MAG: DUF5688 family protein [Lachnospiraceae bacterium]|nr:DUF5688 family protein [Lachnospiraceae bacterium]